MDRIGVLLIDRSRLFREGVRRLFDGSAFAVIHEAADPDEALALVAGGTQPQLVLCDFDEAEPAFLAALARLRANLGAARFVVLTDRVDAGRLAAALDAGAGGYLMKDMSAEALHQSLRLVLLGETVFPRDLAQMLIAGGGAGPARAPQAAGQRGLSERELQILGCLMSGLSNKRIALRLNISEGTVKVHLKAILRKIDARNRTQAAIWAMNNGLEAPPEPKAGSVAVQRLQFGGPRVEGRLPALAVEG